MQVVLAGGFAFDFLDRATGGTLNVDPPAWAIQLVFRIFIDPPLVFFVVNIVWLCTFCYALVRLMQYIYTHTLSLSLSLSLYIYIYIYTHTHTYVYTRTHTYIHRCG